jgi:hypothetical protein
MYTTPVMKFQRRWRRILFRLTTPAYAQWVAGTCLTLLTVRAFVTAAGPKDTRTCFTLVAVVSRRPRQLRRTKRSVVRQILPPTTIPCYAKRSPLCLQKRHLPSALHRFFKTYHRYVNCIASADRQRLAYDGTYKGRKYGEVNDNPIYRQVHPPGFPARKIAFERARMIRAQPPLMCDF